MSSAIHAPTNSVLESSPWKFNDLGRRHPDWLSVHCRTTFVNIAGSELNPI